MLTAFFYCLVTGLDSFLIVTLTAIKLFLIAVLKLRARQICLLESCHLHFVFFLSFVCVARETFKVLIWTFHSILYHHIDLSLDFDVAYQMVYFYRLAYLRTNYRH